MKQEISTKVIAAIIVVVVLVVAVIGWKIFAPRHETTADQDAYFASHPGAKAAYENMHNMGQNPNREPPPNVSIRRSPTPPGRP